MIDDTIISEGKCIYCNEKYSQRSIIKHLKNHLAVFEAENKTSQNTYLIDIKKDEMFLEVLVKGSATFNVLDNFLRNIWVECCDHLSDFSTRNANIDIDDMFDEILSPNFVFSYDYDYGFTTKFDLVVAGIYRIPLKEDLILLSRNQPLKIMCHVCREKPAVKLCKEHMHRSDEYLFCASCSKKHARKCDDFSDYSSSPVVNSPRMGVCGYEGGSIDIERDGPYKM